MYKIVRKKELNASVTLMEIEAPFVAKKAKAEGLTDEEKAEQFKLRREYIDSFKQSLVAQLENTYIVEPDGTKKKVTKIKQ